MEQKTIEALFALLRSALLNQPLSEAERVSFSEEQLLQLIKLAKWHDLEHLLALGLRKNGLTSEKTAEAEKSITSPVTRSPITRKKNVISIFSFCFIDERNDFLPRFLICFSALKNQLPFQKLINSF